jgi:RecA/RadA recombinase
MAKKEAKPKKAQKADKAEKIEKKAKGPKLDISALYGDVMDEIEKRQGVDVTGLDVAPPMSTGLLQIDMLLGGGIRSCMLTGAGNEQCAKTTLALTAMAAAIKEEIPIIGFVDYEGSTKNSKPYVQSILKGSGVDLTVDQVFGKRDKATGKWAIRPRVRYRAETILEKFYEWMAQLLRDLPDKRYVAGNWWLVFDEKNKKHVAKVGQYADKEMARRYGSGLWVPAPNDKIQGIIFVDSYTAMNPAVKDEEDISNQLSVKASAFSKQLERIKGRMADKMVTVYGLNHLRSNPMAMFGPKEEEKGGNALKQFSDVRLRQTSRSLSGPKAYFAPKPGKKGGEATFNEIEKSVEFPGTKDEYRYVHVKAIKNKLWTPDRKTWIRIWVEDGNGVARGIDPVFDTMAYLKDTGQISGNRGALKLNLEGLGKAKTSLTWEECKLWVLGSKEDMIKISKKAGFAPMSLRKFCFKQMKSGVGEDLYVKRKAEKDSSSKSDEGDSSDE